MSNKEIRITVSDLCMIYGCAAGLMYAVAGASYYLGRTKAKLEVINRLDEVVKNRQLTE